MHTSQTFLMSKKSNYKRVQKYLNQPVSNRKVYPNPGFSENKYIHYSLFIIFSFLVYGWTYSFEYSFDDKFILNALNNLDNNFNGFLSIFKQWFGGADYRPISILSFWLERFFFSGINPHISHIVNVFLTAIILINIYELILAGKFYADENKLLICAFLCALLFLVHPIHVNVIANIKSRDNLLSMLFGLMASIQLLKALDQKQYRRIPVYFIFILLALLSKFDSYIFIIIPFIIIVFFRKPEKKFVFRTLAITLFLLFLILFIRSIFYEIPGKEGYIFKLRFDQNPLVKYDTLTNRISLSITSLYYYLKFLFVPMGYHFYFGYDQIQLTPILSIRNIAAVFISVFLLLMSLHYYHFNRIYLFCLCFFILSIMYALNFFVIVGGIVMDRYNFIPSLAFCLALSALIIDYYKAESLTVLRKPIVVLLFLLLVFFTEYRTKDWRSSFTLIDHDMPFLTKSSNANRIAGATYINLALSEEMKPNYDRTYTDSMINIGERYAINGLNIYDSIADLWELRGLSAFYRKDFPLALTFFLKSKDIDSSYISGLNYVGFTYWKLHQIDSAYYYFNHVMKREIIFSYSANNLINMLLENNRKREADSLLLSLKHRFPNDPWLNKRLLELRK